MARMRGARRASGSARNAAGDNTYTVTLYAQTAQASPPSLAYIGDIPSLRDANFEDKNLFHDNSFKFIDTIQLWFGKTLNRLA